MASKGVTAAEQRLRQAKALRLRAAGFTNEQVAEQIGLKTAGGASKVISAGLAHATQEPAQQLRALEAHRYDIMQSRLWPKVLEGDVAAVRAVLRISENRRKLLGLDVPVEFVLRLESEQVEFMEGTMRRFLDGMAAALVAAGHGDVVEGQWEELSSGVLGRELQGLTAAADPDAAAGAA